MAQVKPNKRKRSLSPEIIDHIKAVYHRHQGRLPNGTMASLSNKIGLPRHSIYYLARLNGWVQRRGAPSPMSRGKITPLTQQERSTLTTGELRKRGICCCCKQQPIHPSLSLLCWECHSMADTDPFVDGHDDPSMLMEV